MGFLLGLVLLVTFYTMRRVSHPRRPYKRIETGGVHSSVAPERVQGKPYRLAQRRKTKRLFIRSSKLLCPSSVTFSL